MRDPLTWLCWSVTLLSIQQLLGWVRTNRLERRIQALETRKPPE